MYLSEHFVDKYIGHVSPVYLTGYIYILRHHGGKLSISEACDTLSIASTTLRKILRFWNDQGVINCSNWKDDSDFVFIRLSKYVEEERNVDETSCKDALELLKSEPEFKEVMELAKTVFKINEAVDTPKFAAIWRDYGFDKDTFVALLTYCRDHKAKYPGYMYTIAQKWHNAGISSFEGAQAWIDDKWARFVRFKRAYGRDEYPNDYELKVFRDWDSKYPADKILEAISITMLNGKETNLKYTAGVLRNICEEHS